MARFDGKVVWITGGGSGIGRSTALQFAREGADVAVSGRRVDRLEGVVGELKALGHRAIAVPCDVTDPESVDAAVAKVVADLGGIDVVMANAGLAVGGKVVALDDDTWRRQFEVNVFGVVRTVRAALPHVEARGGRVVLVGSVMAYLTMAKNGAYSASKAALRAIGDTLSLELAGTGVSCTTVHPGFVTSEINQVGNDGVHDPTRQDRRPAQLMWTTEAAARAIVGAVHARKTEFVFTGHGKFAVMMTRLAPGLTRWATGRM